MSRTRIPVLALMVLVVMCSTLVPRAAFADVTLFLGASTTHANRLAKGFSVGANTLALGAEFEFCSTADDVKTATPSLKTGTMSLMLQSPLSVSGFQPYVTAGMGIYREELDSAGHQDTGLALSTGAGIKVTLLGPVRLRLDYRVFRLGGGALYSPAHRVYAGLNLKF